MLIFKLALTSLSLFSANVCQVSIHWGNCTVINVSVLLACMLGSAMINYARKVWETRRSQMGTEVSSDPEALGFKSVSWSVRLWFSHAYLTASWGVFHLEYLFRSGQGNEVSQGYMPIEWKLFPDAPPRDFHRISFLRTVWVIVSTSRKDRMYGFNRPYYSLE